MKAAADAEAEAIRKKAEAEAEAERQKAENRLGGREACMEAEDDDADLPERMRELLDKSQRMYVRVARLDDMMAESAVA